jgi:peroxiredoxin
MTVPEDAPKAIFEYAWTFDQVGTETTIVTNGEYPAVDGEFIGVETTEIQKGYEPPIHDFTIEQNGEDMSQELLQAENLVMVIAYDLAKSNFKVYPELKKVTDEALRKGFKVIGMSASSEEWSSKVINEFKLDFPFYFTDETTLKTIVRSNPGVLVLQKGTIIQKVHYNDLDELTFNN